MKLDITQLISALEPDLGKKMEGGERVFVAHQLNTVWTSFSALRTKVLVEIDGCTSNLIEEEGRLFIATSKNL